MINFQFDIHLKVDRVVHVVWFDVIAAMKKEQELPFVWLNGFIYGWQMNETRLRSIQFRSIPKWNEIGLVANSVESWLIFPWSIGTTWPKYTVYSTQKDSHHHLFDSFHFHFFFSTLNWNFLIENLIDYDVMKRIELNHNNRNRFKNGTINEMRMRWETARLGISPGFLSLFLSSFSSSTQAKV